MLFLSSLILHILVFLCEDNEEVNWWENVGSNQKDGTLKLMVYQLANQSLNQCIEL